MRIDIVYFQAGSGHLTSACALRDALLLEHPDWDVRTVDMAEIFDERPWILGVYFRIGVNLLNACMRRERYLGFTPLVWTAIGWGRFLNWFLLTSRFVSAGLARFWKTTPPDIVISTTPMMHPLVFEGAGVANPDVLCITIPVDHEEMTPGYWFHPKIDQYYLTGTEQLRNQALELGVNDSEISQLSGCIIHPEFYRAPPVDRAEELTKLGLDPNLKTVMISFGGQGTVNVIRIATQIVQRQLPLNIICLCGRNAALLKLCKELETHNPLLAVSFSDDPPVLYHHLADVSIGKPGTLTLNEALITQTPFIFVKSTGLAPIQSGNEEWMLKRKVGVMAHSVNDVVDKIVHVLDTPEYIEHAKAEYHRGIFNAVAHIKKLANR